MSRLLTPGQDSILSYATCTTRPLHHYPESLRTGFACDIRVSSLVQELTALTSHPQWDWASPISGEREVDPRISDFLREKDVDPLDPYVLGHFIIENGRCRRTKSKNRMKSFYETRSHGPQDQDFDVIVI